MSKRLSQDMSFLLEFYRSKKEVGREGELNRFQGMIIRYGIPLDFPDASLLKKMKYKVNIKLINSFPPIDQRV